MPKSKSLRQANQQADWSHRVLTTIRSLQRDGRRTLNGYGGVRVIYFHPAPELLVLAEVILPEVAAAGGADEGDAAGRAVEQRIRELAFDGLIEQGETLRLHPDIDSGSYRTPSGQVIETVLEPDGSTLEVRIRDGDGKWRLLLGWQRPEPGHAGVRAYRMTPLGLERLSDANPIQRMSWQEAQTKAEAYVKCHPFPGQTHLARIVGCSPHTMGKAIERSTRLTAEKAKHEKARSGRRPVTLSDKIETRAPQTSETDPAQQAETDDTMRRLIEQSDNAKVRAYLNGLDDDARHKVAEFYGRAPDDCLKHLSDVAIAGTKRELD